MGGREPNRIYRDYALATIGGLRVEVLACCTYCLGLENSSLHLYALAFAEA